MPLVAAVSKADFDECVGFIAPREARCVTLMSHLVSGEGLAFPGNAVRLFVSLREAEGGRIDGIVLVAKNGILLHCFREGASVAPYAPAMARLLARASVRCAIGEREGTLAVETILARTPSRAVDYRLMTLDARPGVGIPPGIEINRGRREDVDRVLPLQEGYEREEIIPPGDPYDRDATRAQLLRNLESQYVYLARASGEIVAKAGTNALGLRWNQLGGVYTLPSWRGRGLATALVSHVARERLDAGKKVALFVKLTNAPAIAAYTRVGFVGDRLFRISYW